MASETKMLLSRHWLPGLMALVILLAGGCPAAAARAPVPAATQLYIGHSARLTAAIPATWQVDPTGIWTYVGPDGGIISRPLPAASLDAACHLIADDPVLGTGSFALTTWAGQPACGVDGHWQGQEISTLVLRHPYPFMRWNTVYDFAAIITDRAHADVVRRSLSFAPEQVTPDVFLASVLDLVEGRAYWSGEVEWTWRRENILETARSYDTLDEARGELEGILSTLRAYGDNHSFLIFEDAPNFLAEGSGFGMRIAANRVVLVYEGSPADQAGLELGDVITAVDGHPYLPPAGVTDPAYLWAQSATLTIARDGTVEPLTVTIEQAPYRRYAPPTGARLPRDIGYVALYEFGTPGDEVAYVTTGQDLLRQVDSPAVCGWIVDLRVNLGGNYAPMISAIGPVLGEGRFVGWQDAAGREQWVSYEDGAIRDDGLLVSHYLPSNGLYQPVLEAPPVAVLTSTATGSAGEVATLAFVGRERTRLFGERTGGYTTANAIFPLFDGTLLGLAVSVMMDRDGATHLEGIEPDQVIANDWAAFGTGQDPVLAAAREWLDQQPACALKGIPVA